MLDRPRREVAEVFQRYRESRPREAEDTWSWEQRAVIDALLACRTARLGGHVDECDSCSHRTISYNSCRNRHCPKCQGSAQAAWLQARQADVLPVPYAHVVFTLPQLLAPLALQNPSVFYDLLLRTTARTLQEVAANPRHLGARLGFFAILHTWGQTLVHHPHVHCVVPAGGLADDGRTWKPCRPGFFLPVRVLSRLFRGKFLDELKHAFHEGSLQFHGRLAPLATPRAFDSYLQQARQTDWVVYAKPPFEHPDHVLEYLARYTHRVAISNSRLLHVDNRTVTFRYKHYRSQRVRSLTLPLSEFVRRFLLHVLPKGFVRIRYYGFLANGARARLLSRCRNALGYLHSAPAERHPQTPNHDELSLDLPPSGLRPCPRCQQGVLRCIQILERPPPTLGYPRVAA